MRRQDIAAFARRDWAAVADAKSRYWARRKRTMDADQALAVGETLRQHARSLKPDWPDADERAADLSLHVRVSEALRAVSAHRAR
jgi:hypothetical protein